MCLGVCFAIVLILFQFGMFKLNRKTSTQKIEKTPELIVVYPFNNTLFPPEISAPSFKWHINITGIKNWFVEFSTSGKEIYSAYIFDPKLQPDSLLWQRIKKTAKYDLITFRVTCQFEDDSSTSTLSAITNFKFSFDSVGAPLFFRKLDLPFKFINERLSSVEWCLGDISNYQQAKTLLSGVNTCGNCHSFSLDGKVMGIDFDYLTDKGGYAISEINKNTAIDKSHFHSWNNQVTNEMRSSGFLSTVSPDGRYVCTTINDRSIASIHDNEFRFFPVNGVLGVYDRITQKSRELSGANDTMFVQSNATWSPDGKTIIFAKAQKLTKKELNDVKTMKEFTEGEKEFRFDLWSVPFNSGNGGIAKPITGAYSNGKSNYFPRVSPDGKWIVFTQANSYMLRQLDSKLCIVPFGGGEARELECNMDEMNSWHSWSPNSKWVAFSTKGFSPYTKIALTHIDSDGHASPPVLLGNFIYESKAVNLPEFVNIDYNRWNSIHLDFLNPFIISNVDLRMIHDGIYQGKSMLNDNRMNLISATVELQVEKSKIVKIKLVDSKGISIGTDEICSKIIQSQSIDLIKLNVNSLEEKVLIKAIEDGLMKSISE